MAYRNMTLDELARHLGMDARVVKKWAERGRLPGVMVRGQWRFNRAQLLDWLQREIHTLDREHIANLERAMSDGSEEQVLGDLLSLEAIDMNLPARSRASVLRELVKLAERTGLVYDPAGILKAVQEREGLRTTALPKGFAIPHPRRPMPYATAEPLVCLARVPNPVAFGAPDGAQTQLFFLICSHEGHAHLHVLARLMRMLNDGLIDTLRAVQDPAQALQLMIAREEDVAKTVA